MVCEPGGRRWVSNGLINALARYFMLRRVYLLEFGPTSTGEPPTVTMEATLSMSQRLASSDSISSARDRRRRARRGVQPPPSGALG